MLLRESMLKSLSIQVSRLLFVNRYDVLRTFCLKLYKITMKCVAFSNL